MVIAELNKFSTPLFAAKTDAYKSVYCSGLRGLFEADMQDILNELVAARKMPKNSKEEKDLRSFAIDVAQSKLSSRKTIDKYYKNLDDFCEPDYSAIDKIYDEEELCDIKLKELNIAQSKAKNQKTMFF